MADKFPQTDWKSGRPASLLLDDGFAGKLMDAEFFAAPPAGGLVKVWLGAAWEAKPVKVWGGLSWDIKPLKFWDGAQWATS